MPNSHLVTSFLTPLELTGACDHRWKESLKHVLSLLYPDSSTDSSQSDYVPPANINLGP